jgi:hypothetical protein
MGIAKPVKILNKRQTVYELDPPYKRCGGDGEHKFVVTSKAIAWTGQPAPSPPGEGLFSEGFFAGYTGGNPREVLIFPSNGENITDMGEIGGSYDEPEAEISALRDMGYTIQG